MNKRGIVFIAIGALMLIAALGLAVYNLYEDGSAGKDSCDALMQLSDSGAISRKERTFSGDPNMTMPTKRIGDWDYIGALELPTLKLVLPVIDQWNDEALQTAPARFAGSAYLDNMVIAAHNYSNHFGRLQELSLEDDIRFTDVDGNVFVYRVQELEVLQPTDVEEMITDDGWNLTLFTCTWGGQSRVTVRCTRALQHQN